MSTENKNIAPDKNLLEWAVFGLSFLLVLAILGYLAFRAAKHVNSPPDLSVEHTLQPGHNNENRYRIKVYNKGGQTAENVKIEVTLKNAQRKEQKANLDLPFSPVNSEREGWVVFEGIPMSADSVSAKIVSYKKP